ncbi:unnamed protein product [Polarella glacialis]|uniref:Reverse transcriptase domain-containing protein n=1 Tax=Polarella glacialis TaxID=89957 RepID=A0A813EHG3_POLGL|nr:unnamed protein product [Polarella glacialis]CAE8601557.1 unnamed protein product [Polarella glacialis]
MHTTLLLVQWICSQNAVVHWTAMVARHGVQTLYAVADLVALHPRPVYRMRGVQKLAWYMRVANELPFSTVVIKLPPGVSASKAWSVLRDAKDSISGNMACRWNWMPSHLRFAKQPVPTIRRRRCCMARDMKDARWNDYAQLPGELVAEINKGAEMVRVKLWAKFADLGSSSSARGLYCQDVYRAGHKFRLRGERFEAFTGALKPLARHSCQQKVPMSALHSYASQHPHPDVNRCLVQEDKDTAACWIMNRTLYQLRMYDLLAKDDKWVLADISVAEAAKQRAEVINRTVLQSRRPLAASADPVHLPYGYGTVKAKCFKLSPETGSTHSCCDPGRSCFRKIVSWASCEKSVRQLFRQAGRATTLVVAKYCLGWETTSLKTSATDLRARLAGLPQPSFDCSECGAPRGGRYCMIVADAGQMFEQIRASNVLQNLRELFSRAGTDGYKSVNLRTNTRRLAGGLSKKAIVTVSNAETWLFSDLLALVELSLQVSLLYVRWGDRVIQQRSGSPIGGLMSCLHAMLSLGPSEVACMSRGGDTWKDHVAAIRYVDDSLLVSATQRCSCLRKVISSAAPAHIEFNIEQESTSQVSWLDLTISDSGGRLGVDVAYPELAWLKGESAYPERQRWPPYLDEVSFSAIDFKQRIKAVVARWNQVGLEDVQLQRAVAHLMAMLGRSNYPLRLILKSLCRWGGPQVAAWARHWHQIAVAHDDLSDNRPQLSRRVRFCN